MIPSGMTSLGRRKFFGAIGLGAAALLAAALLAAAKNPFTSFFHRTNERNGNAASVVTITPNPMAVQRTRKGTAHHG